MLENIIKKPIKVKEIIQNSGVDGFTIILTNGEVMSITGTQWNTGTRKRICNDDLFFSTNKGYEILFSKNQIKDLNKFY